MPFEIRQGDLFTSGLPALAHGCNCQGIMGAGIAAQFRKRWPEMYAEYRRRCATGKFRPGDVMTWYDAGWPAPLTPPVTIYCLATQDKPGPDARLAAVTASVSRMLLTAQASAVPAIGLPRIGCGIGGLDWADVGYLLEILAAGSPVELTVYEYDLKERNG